MGERLLCKQEVVGSIPSGSTKLRLVEPDEFKLLPVPASLRAGGLAPPLEVTPSGVGPGCGSEALLRR